MSKIRRVGELFEQKMEIRETISAKKYGEQGEQGNYFNKIQRAGELFQQNTESRGTI